MTHGASIPTLPSVAKYPRRFPAPGQYLQTSIGLSTTKTVWAGFYQAKRAQVKTKDRPRPRKSSFNIEEIIFFEGKILRQQFSGSHLHVDPDLTGAWSYLVTGQKWWVVLAEGKTFQDGSRRLREFSKAFSDRGRREWPAVRR